MNLEPNSNSSHKDNHETVDVTIFSIDGTKVGTIKRAVRIGPNGDRVVAFLKKDFRLRSKKGVDNAVVLQKDEVTALKKMKSMTESKKFKIRLGDLKRILKEEINVDYDDIAANMVTKMVLREGDEEQPVKEDGNDSLDNQVDKYLNDYESEAKSSKTEGADWRRTVRRIVEDADTDEDAGGDMFGGDASEGEDADEGDDAAVEDTGEDAEPAKLGAEDIDVNSFTNSIVRLIDNYDSLLEVRNTIMRRGANFLSKNYEPEVVEAFKDNLRENHGLEIGRSESEAADEFSPPPAERASGPSPAGGA